MKEPTKDDIDFLAEAHDRFMKINLAEDHNRKAALEDLKFVYNIDNGQWPQNIRDERAEEERPCLTSNKLRKFVAQVSNRERDQRLACNVRPVDSKGDVEIANIMSGIIRQVEYVSNAEKVYTEAGEHAVAAGFGYWRIESEELPDSFEQELFIRPIKNQFSVYLDPDRMFAFVREKLTPEEFKYKFPDHEPDDFQSGQEGEYYNDWYDTDDIYIAEYFYKERVKTEIVEAVSILTGETRIYRLTDKVTEETLKQMGFFVERRKTEKMHKVKWSMITGSQVLERGEWPGEEIPIICVEGDWVNLDGKVYKRSLVADGKDDQRMYNYWKPLALDTPIPTPEGWSSIGSIKVGDSLFDDKGYVCKVKGLSPVYKDRECLKITFDDGSSIVSDKEHLWEVEERGKRKSKTYEWNKKIISSGDLVPDKHFIYTALPLKSYEVPLEIHPYLLGLWLGDGDSNTGRITMSSNELAEVKEKLLLLGYKTSDLKECKDRAPYLNVYGLLPVLRKNNLIKNKHIPPEYLRGSYEQRLMLLRGLMDSDGSIDKKFTCSFTTINPVLKDGFEELLRTFGIKAVFCIRQKREPYLNKKTQQTFYSNSEPFQFSFTAPSDFCVFNLKRKASVQNRKTNNHDRRTKRYSIKSVEKVATVPVKCISVTSPTNLFLVGKAMIPTHNTTMTETVALAPKSPWLVTPAMIKGFKDRFWNVAHKKLLPYLPFNPQGKFMPRREPPPQVPTGAATMLELCQRDIQDTIGMYDSSFGERSNERTGIAIRQRAARSDFGTFHFADNFRRAVQDTARQLIDLIPKIYDTKRTLRILGEQSFDGKPIDNFVTINDVDPITGEMINDLSVGKYDVVADVKIMSTRRQEEMEGMASLMQASPNIAPLLLPELAKNMDWPGAKDIAMKVEKFLPALLGVQPSEGGEPTPGETGGNGELNAGGRYG